jgi:hypothetical protein
VAHLRPNFGHPLSISSQLRLRVEAAFCRAYPAERNSKPKYRYVLKGTTSNVARAP